MGKETTRTYGTRFLPESNANEVLHCFAHYYAFVQHKLFAEVASGKKADSLKNEYVERYQITARHFNSLKNDVEGKIDSIKKKRALEIKEQKEKILSLKEKIKKLEKSKKDQSFLIHQKKRRLDKLQNKLKKLQEDHSKGKVSLCFGSKKLFRAQFSLEENGYKDHQEWLKDWKQARAREIFFIGSKDETSGNLNCTAIIEPDQTISLRVRLPDALKNPSGKYLFLKNLNFNYGQEEILTALGQDQALTWRMLFDEKGWRIFVSLDVKPAPCTSNQDLGVIGLDINSDHLALVETDPFGNPIFKKTIPLSLHNKTTHQAKAIIGDAAKAAIAHAQKVHKPLIIEDLDFQKKKASLREKHTKSHSRMLSSFCYQSIITHLKSNGSKKGVLVEQVNPAYTSIIGRVKFAKRYGITIHQAAALTIGRRFLEYSEKVPSCLRDIPDGRGGHVTLTLPVRNRAKHVWTTWRQLNKKLSVALIAHFRTAKSRSSSPYNSS
jgi:IS605 OrfB family transposase